MQRQTPGFKLPSDYTSENNPLDIPNIKGIYRSVLNSNKLPFIIILAFVGIPNIKRIIRDLLKPKKLSFITMIFVGRYVFRKYTKDKYTIIHGYISRDQGTDKNETCKNELKDSGEIFE